MNSGEINMEWSVTTPFTAKALKNRLLKWPEAGHFASSFSGYILLQTTSSGNTKILNTSGMSSHCVNMAIRKEIIIILLILRYSVTEARAGGGGGRRARQGLCLQNSTSGVPGLGGEGGPVASVAWEVGNWSHSRYSSFCFQHFLHFNTHILCMTNVYLCWIGSNNPAGSSRGSCRYTCLLLRHEAQTFVHTHKTELTVLVQVQLQIHHYFFTMASTEAPVAPSSGSGSFMWSLRRLRSTRAGSPCVRINKSLSVCKYGYTA